MHQSLAKACSSSTDIYLHLNSGNKATLDLNVYSDLSQLFQKAIDLASFIFIMVALC